MSASEIISLIDAEILSLQQARALLSDATSPKQPGRPAKAVSIPTATKGKKRKMSPEGRARIAAAVKARWAAAKKDSK